MAAGDSGAVTVCVNKAGAARFVTGTALCKKGEHAVLLQAAIQPQPTDFTVDCNAGQKIQDVLDQVANGTEPVWIDVSGTCNESVRISRDDVTLNAASPGAAIHDPDYALTLDGARHVEVDGMTLSAASALSAWFGSTFEARDLHITGMVEDRNGSSGRLEDSTVEGAERSGLWVTDTSSVYMTGGSVTDSGNTGVSCGGSAFVSVEDVIVSGSRGAGIDVAGTCTTNVWGGAVRDNGSGVNAWAAADAEVQGGTMIEGNHGAGAIAQGGANLGLDSSVVRDNGNGISGFQAGTIAVTGSTIDSNHGDGLSLVGGSTAFVGDTSITGNQGNGIWIGDTSMAMLGHGPDRVTDNRGWGIWCQSAPAVAMIKANGGLTVSGNTAGDNACQVAP